MDARRKLAHSQSAPLESGKTSWLRSHSDGDWKDAWKSAVRKAREAKDLWAKQNIVESCKTEKALRYRYNAFEKRWVRDEIEVKMQSEVALLIMRIKSLVGTKLQICRKIGNLVKQKHRYFLSINTPQSNTSGRRRDKNLTTHHT